MEMKTSQPRAHDYEGSGGPEDKVERDGRNDFDVEGGANDQIGNTDRARSGVLQEGEDAVLSNVGRHPPGPGGNKY